MIRNYCTTSFDMQLARILILEYALPDSFIYTILNLRDNRAKQKPIISN